MVRRRSAVHRDREPEVVEVGLDELFWPQDDRADAEPQDAELEDEELQDEEPGANEPSDDEDDPVGYAEWGDEERRDDETEVAGASFGVAFFGWLVASGTAVLLMALVAAVGAVIGWDRVAGWSKSGWFLVGVWTVLVLSLGVGAYSGGYAGGRMVPCHGGRQGLGVWFFGWSAVGLLAGVSYLAYREHELVASIDWAAIPVAEPDRARAALIALAAILLVTLVGAVLGGASGNKK